MNKLIKRILFELFKINQIIKIWNEGYSQMDLLF